MKIGTLIKELQALVEPLGDKGLELEVKGWLPGSTLSISKPFLYKSNTEVRIELNVDPGSAIERMTKLY